MTQCTGCNIAISIRIASPGDSGDVVQTTQVDATAVVAAVAEATQAAAQTVVPPKPPVVPPPAPPLTSGLATAGNVTPVLPKLPDPPAVVPLVPPAPVAGSVEAAAVHSAPLSRAEAAPVAPRRGVHRRHIVNVRHVFQSTVVHSTSVVHVRTVVRTVVRDRHRAATPALRAPLRFPPAPSAPLAPGAFAPAANEGHGSVGFTPLALALGGVGAFLLTFLAYAAPGLQTVRPRPAQANPDPPG